MQALFDRDPQDRQSGLNVRCWVQALFDAQLGSIKALQPAWGGDHDKRPHVLATRYASLAASLLLLNANYQARRSLACSTGCPGSAQPRAQAACGCCLAAVPEILSMTTVPSVLHVRKGARWCTVWSAWPTDEH